MHVGKDVLPFFHVVGVGKVFRHIRVLDSVSKKLHVTERRIVGHSQYPDILNRHTLADFDRTN